MKTLIKISTTAVVLAIGCAGYPPPTQRMADVQSASRSANELGAQNHPNARLHAKLAEDQMKQAKVAMDNDDNEVADRLLVRAKADAELAIALTREEDARTAAGSAVDQSNAQRNTNLEQGAAR
jgi:hypothetical protein